MTDDEIRAVTVGRAVRSVNLLTGCEATLSTARTATGHCWASATARSSRKR